VAFVKKAAPNAITAGASTATASVGLELSSVCICWLWKVMLLGFPAWVWLSVVYAFRQSRRLMLQPRDGASAFELEGDLIRRLGGRSRFRVQWDVVGWAIIAGFFFLFPTISRHTLIPRFHANLILGAAATAWAIRTLIVSLRRPHAWAAT
jgi:hypothetical protein